MSGGTSSEEPLDAARHDVKNVLTALESGCNLVERGLRQGNAEEALEYVAEMRAEIEKGFALAERIRAR